MRLLISVALFGLLTVAGAWDLVFKSSQCYPTNVYGSSGVLDSLVGNRMPLSMDNFVALMESYERQHSNNNPDRIADSLIARYRKDGMVYDPKHTAGMLFQPIEQEEVSKQDVLYKLLTPSYDVPEDTFQPREECSLHLMMSHSTDTYPHPDVDDFWESNGRFRRAASPGPNIDATGMENRNYSLPDIVEVDSYPTPRTSSLSSTSTTQSTVTLTNTDRSAVSMTSESSRPTSPRTTTLKTTSHSVVVTPKPLAPRTHITSVVHRDSRFSSYALPPGVDPANHPIENGVILTAYGPVALGTLLAGIASSVSGTEQTIATIFGDKEVVYMPDEMKAKRLNPLHVATIAGDIAQAALKAAMISTTTSKYFLGPSGMFSNNTAAPRLFTLSDGYGGTVAYLTRAEIFAGIDAILIQQYLKSASSSRTKLSQILRMYYSDRGLPNHPTFKACNRMEAYNSIRDDAKTKEQALNFMYAYADSDSLAHQHISENRDDFNGIESFFSTALNDAWNTFTSFVGGYNHEDYDSCPTSISSSISVKCENTVDLVVVYNREGGSQATDDQRAYITLVAETIGVSQTRSRLGVIDASNGKWIMPVTNVSNIADLGANFTMDTQQFGSAGSSKDMMTILDTLRLYYFEFYNTTNSSADNATAHSQVVVWNVPRKAPDFNDDNNLQILRDFRLDFPNVYFLLVGTSSGEYLNVLTDREKDFFKINIPLDTEATAKLIANRVCEIPSVFVYPACNTDIPAFESYNEDSHYFEGVLSPNYTTYAMIAPQNFKYSYRLTLSPQNDDVRVCASRVSMVVDSNAEDYVCHDSGTLEWTALCTERNLTRCNPIYLSIYGTPTGNIPICTVEGCQYPNQIQYQIGHQGLKCGAGSFSVSVILLAIVSLLNYFVAL